MNSADKKKLRADAHTLKPVVMIGQSGLTAAVLAEIELALGSHELIKLNIFNRNNFIINITARRFNGNNIFHLFAN